jgi:hypothetical protein
MTKQTITSRNDKIMIAAMANGIASGENWETLDQCAKVDPAAARIYKRHARDALKGLMDLRKDLMRQELKNKNSPCRKAMEKYGMKVGM